MKKAVFFVSVALLIIIDCFFLKISRAQPIILQLSRQTIPTYTAKDIDAAVRNGTLFISQSSGNDSTLITVDPVASETPKAKNHYSLALSLQSASPIIGFSLYVFYKSDSTKISYDAGHNKLWIAPMSAKNPGASKSVAKELGTSQFNGFNKCFLAGVLFKQSLYCLGDILIETSNNDSFKFVIYAKK
jgi:hypothetical protein